MAQLGRDIAYPKNTQRGVKDVGAVAIAHGKVLAVVGASGPRLTVQMADADSATLRDTELLVALGGIEANGIGRAVEWCVLEDVNTNGSTIGDPVYLSGTTGGWTLTAPASAVKIGVVLVVGAATGKVLLHPGKFAGAGLTGGAFTDNRVLRAHGTTGIQDSLWTMNDTGNANVPNDASIYGADASFANTGWTQYGALYASIGVSVGGAVYSHLDVHSAGWTINGTSRTKAQVDDWWTIAGLAVADGNVIVGNGTTWVAESGSTARASLAIGPPICAVRTTEFDVTDTEATITFESVPITSTEIAHAAGELTVSVTGRYKIEFTAYGLVTTADSTESSMTVLMQDDTGAQGSDVNTAGTTRLVVAGPTNGIYGAGISITHIIDLDAGDTVRFRADRGDVGGTCRVVGGVTMQRIG